MWQFCIRKVAWVGQGLVQILDFPFITLLFHVWQFKALIRLAEPDDTAACFTQYCTKLKNPTCSIPSWKSKTVGFIILIKAGINSSLFCWKTTASSWMNDLEMKDKHTFHPWQLYHVDGEKQQQQQQRVSYSDVDWKRLISPHPIFFSILLFNALQGTTPPMMKSNICFRYCLFVWLCVCLQLRRSVRLSMMSRALYERKPYAA